MAEEHLLLELKNHLEQQTEEIQELKLKNQLLNGFANNIFSHELASEKREETCEAPSDESEYFSKLKSKLEQLSKEEEALNQNMQVLSDPLDLEL